MINSVELIGYYGSDETHALSAWTSTSRELTTEKRARIPQLLYKLAKDGHHTPFEKSTLHFLVVTDNATHIQLIKHRIGVSINAESARYRELLEDKAYVPEDWPLALRQELERHAHESFMKYHETVTRLEKEGFSRKRAKESARFFLPYASQIRADVAFNFRSFMHFCGLRNSEHAQKEIRDLTRGMLALVRSTGAFNESLIAFGY